MRKNLFIAFIFLMFAHPSMSQDQCAIALNEAQSKYETGRLYEIPELLNSCINQGFTKEQRITAYRLLTLTYLYLNYYAEADKAYLELLKLSPEYKVNNELDPMEIINHHYKFTTKPIFYLTPFKLGVNLSYANVLMDYSISSSQNGSDSYSAVLGGHAGLGAEMVVFQNLHVACEFIYTNQKIRLTDTHWDFYKINMDITHNKVQIPILLKYNFYMDKIMPFIEAGISPAYMLNSFIQNIEGVYFATIENGELEEFPVQPRPEISTAKLNKAFNYSSVLGAGINYKIGLNYLSFEVRYATEMLNITEKNGRWREDLPEARDLKFPAGHVADDYKLNNLSFFVGFVKPLYKPRKIK